MRKALEKALKTNEKIQEKSINYRSQQARIASRIQLCYHKYE